MKKPFHLLTAIAALIFASLACQSIRPTTTTPAQTNPAVAVPTVAPILVSADNVNQQETLTSLYQNVLPGIVAIQVTTAQGGSLGTGIVFDDQGHIVTNQHVVNGQESIEVDFSSGYKATAKLVGMDSDSDLAVIKVDAPASEIHPLPLGDSKLLNVGQSVVAIGNPFGLNGSMTLGIISALGRTQDSNREVAGGGNFSVADMIQTDAAINPGNSGGPLFNINGEIIGINRSIRTDASNVTGEPVNSGIGFAIPINLVKRVVPAIIKDGKFEYPYMGISALQSELMSLKVINELGIKSMTGVYITGVLPGGPAEKAGMIGASRSTNVPGLESGGDLVVAIDGNPVKIYDDLIGYLVDYKSPGEQITLTVLRGDQKVDLTLTLTKRP
ncbi:MAG: trypsin-like peptidase domain-containing protein [Chloroflexi bacterium]|nr:trypsin-like peptidase domain-containing protein [Chloroflexota bacterium]